MSAATITKKIYGKGRAWKKAGVNVLSLRGTYPEMAGQHGALLKDEIRNGAMVYLGQKNDHLIAQSHLFRDRPWMQKLAKGLVRAVIQKPMLAQIPRGYFEEAHAICRTSGMKYEHCEQAMLQADTLLLLLRFFLGRYVLKQMAGGFPGCTSILAIGDAAANGGVLHARNMDYPVVGRWDIHPTVFYCDPEGADRGQRVVGVATAGVHSPGVTAINESGLTLSTHFHCAKAVSPFGIPIQLIGSEVIRKARALGQAVDLAGSLMRAGTWSLVVSSAREKSAAIIEMTHGKISVVEPEQGLLAHTNHFHTREFQDREVLLSASVGRDYVERYGRAMDLLRLSRGRVDRAVAARILGDHFDRETGKLRSQGNTISVVTTVTSMIAEASQGRFWVANSGESPTCLGDYAGFRVDEGFGETYDEREPEIFAWSTTGATTIRGTPKHEAFRYFRDAYVAFHTDFDLKRAAESARRAAEADPDEGHYHMAHGHFRMRLGQTDTALEAFRKACQCVMGRHMREVAALFSAHALDVLGRRVEAIPLYQGVLDATDPHVRDEARRCLRKAYRSERARKITFDLQFCDSFEYA